MFECDDLFPSIRPRNLMMGERTSYPYGYKPIQPKQHSAPLPEWERQKAQARRNNLKNQKSYKVLLIGESGVGKSTLVARLCDDRFLAESKQHTLGNYGNLLTCRLIAIMRYMQE